MLGLFCAVSASVEAAPTERRATQANATRMPLTAQRATIAPQNQTGASQAGANQARAAQPMRAQPVAARGAAARLGTALLPVAASGGLSCVPFARMATGMTISGDARLWWYNAAGAYRRGQEPERGAVLAFMASGGMSRGHVAVVSQVVNDRTLLIDHANWGGPGIRRGTVMRSVTVVDVSDRNDWTAVRVQVGHSAEAFGRTYPTHGFIYNRPLGPRILTAGAEPTQEVAEAASPHAAQHRRLTEALAN